METCAICNAPIEELPMCLGSSSPASRMVPEDEYDNRVVENADQCIVDDEHYFIRGHIEILIQNSNQVFIWSIWVSLSEASFEKMSESWEKSGRENNAPYFGWLVSSLPCYPETLHLKTSVQEQPIGQVPKIILEKTEHPLSVEQNHGITMSRVQEFVHVALGH